MCYKGKLTITSYIKKNEPLILKIYQDPLSFIALSDFLTSKRNAAMLNILFIKKLNHFVQT